MGGRIRGGGKAAVTAEARATEPDAVTSQTTTLAPRLPGEAKVDNELVDQAVEQINRLYTGRALEMAREIGAYVLETFFAGDANNFRERGGEHATFRELSEREDLQFSKIWLWRAVSVYDQLKLLPENIAEALPYTHHTLLLPLHDETKKIELAKKAVEKGWTKDVLQAEVTKVREKEKTSKGGRKPLLPFVKTVNRLEKFLASEEEHFSGLDEVEELDEDEVKRIQKTIKRMKLKLDQIALGLKVSSDEVPEPE